jgi:hypothetical protein
MQQSHPGSSEIKIKHGPRISADALSGVTGVVTVYVAFIRNTGKYSEKIIMTVRGI